MLKSFSSIGFSKKDVGWAWFLLMGGLSFAFWALSLVIYTLLETTSYTEHMYMVVGWLQVAYVVSMVCLFIFSLVVGVDSWEELTYILFVLVAVFVGITIFSNLLSWEWVSSFVLVPPILIKTALFVEFLLAVIALCARFFVGPYPEPDLRSL